MRYLIAEAWANFRSRGPIYTVAVLLCSVAGIACATVELGARDARRGDEIALRESGGHLIVLVGDFDVARCEQLPRRVSAVARSGTVATKDRLHVPAAASGVQVDEVTPGFVGLLGVDVPATGVPYVIAGPRVRERIELRSVTVGVSNLQVVRTNVEWLGDRAFGLLLPTLEVSGNETQCWVEVDDIESYEDVAEVTPALIGADSTIEHRRPNVVDSVEQIEARYRATDPRVSLWAVLAIAAAVGGFLTLVEVRETVVYRACGLGAVDSMAIAVAHNAMFFTVVAAFVAVGSVGVNMSSHVNASEALTVAATPIAALFAGLLPPSVLPAVVTEGRWQIALRTE